MKLFRGMLGTGPTRIGLGAGPPLNATHVWKSRLHGYTAHAVALSPNTSSVYAGDGWGSTYSAMRVRRFSLATGVETASARVFNGLRCSTLADDDTRLIAVLDSKIFEFDPHSLVEIRRWDRRVPRFGQSVAVIGSSIVTANWMSPRVGIIDRESGSVRLRDAPSMTQVVGAGKTALLVGGDRQGGVSELLLPDALVHQLLVTSPTLHAARTHDGASLIAIEGIRGKVSGTSASNGGPSTDVQVLSLRDPAALPQAFRLPHPAAAAVAGRNAVAFAVESEVHWAAGALGDAPLRRWVAPDDQKVVAVDPDLGLVVTIVGKLLSKGGYVSSDSYADMNLWRLDVS